MSEQKSVIIVGSGLGGLSTALRLASKGYAVTILEKGENAGGRLNELKQDGFTFDMGPSFFSMSYEFDELFKDCNIQNPLQYQQLDPLYTVNFAGEDKRYHIYMDREKLAKEFENMEPGFKEKLEAYLKNAGEIFHDTEYKIVKRNFESKLHYLATMTTVPLKHAPRMMRSMWTELGNYFDSHEVKVIFSLVGFFLGATPYDTPAVYKLLNYTELVHDGYWNVKGGMYRIVETMLNELAKHKVNIVYNTEIVSVEENCGNVVAMVDQNGAKYVADLYVTNADAASFRGKILNREGFDEEALDEMDWTLSPFTIYLGVKGKMEGLHHHNYFLGNNFKDYADKIFKTSVNPEKPYYYVNVSSKSNAACAPEGCENLFILCPMPDLRYKPDWNDADELANNIIDDLGKRVGFDIKNNILTKKIMTPVDWMNKFNLYKGSGLGLAHGMDQVGGFRPANKDEELNNLYYVGASTIPGTGLPMVVIGSRLVTERILKDHPTLDDSITN
jgi:phytoene desaturase